jgi:Golgi nucleoside diphosphatase
MNRDSGINSSENCFNDCFLSLINKTYDCFKRPETKINVNFDSHLLSHGYRICNQFMDRSIEGKLRIECLEKCLPYCESINYETKLETRAEKTEKQFWKYCFRIHNVLNTFKL